MAGLLWEAALGLEGGVFVCVHKRECVPAHVHA